MFKPFDKPWFIWLKLKLTPKFLLDYKALDPECEHERANYLNQCEDCGQHNV